MNHNLQGGNTVNVTQVNHVTHVTQQNAIIEENWFQTKQPRALHDTAPVT